MQRTYNRSVTMQDAIRDKNLQRHITIPMSSSTFYSLPTANNNMTLRYSFYH